MCIYSILFIYVCELCIIIMYKYYTYTNIYTVCKQKLLFCIWLVTE